MVMLSSDPRPGERREEKATARRSLKRRRMPLPPTRSTRRASRICNHRGYFAAGGS